METIKEKENIIEKEKQNITKEQKNLPPCKKD
jgi:hypothetical protein